MTEQLETCSNQPFPSDEATEEVAPINIPGERIVLLGTETARRLAMRPGDDLDEVVKRLHGQVRSVVRAFSELRGRCRQATLEVAENGTFEILVPNDVSRQQRRKLIAHEIGHYILHSRRGTAMRAWLYSPSPAEHEADRFAMGLLMPDKDVRETHRRFGGILVEIVDVFQVDLATARARCEELGLSVT
jgi:hypothetical protein